MACLFCLNTLTSEKGPGEHIVTPEVINEESPLTTNLGDPAKNLEAFNCLCQLLKVNWRNTEEGGDDEDSDHRRHEIGDNENVTFDSRQPLPLCCRCQTVYQDVYQLYQQIWELEVMMMKNVKVIRETIETSGNGGLQLACSKLNEFRRMVLEESTIYNQSLLETIPNAPMFLSQEEYLDIKQEVLENVEDDNVEADLLEHFKPEVKLEENFEESEYQLVEEKVHSPSSSNSKSKAKRHSSRLLIIKTFEKPKTDSPTKSRQSEKQLKSKSGSGKKSPKKSTTSTTTDIPEGRSVKSSKRKLKQVTESTPKIHIDCFTCCYCGLRFNHTGTLSKHKRRHEPRQLKCPLCPKMFALDSDVNRHLKLVHKRK